MNFEAFENRKIKEEFMLDQEELFENPDPRIPICLALDVSSSMRGEPITELQEGIESFFSAIRSDEIASSSAEISIITFGVDVEIALDFRSIEKQIVPKLEARGLTPMGEAVETALDLLEARKSEYRNAGVDYYQPWLVLMSDGYPTDSIDEAARRTADLAQKRKLTIFPIAIGKADTDILSRLGGGRKALRLKGLEFDKFFEWLSRSVSRVSQSTPGEKVSLPEGLESWAEL